MKKESRNGSGMPTSGERIIGKLYEYAVVLAPIVVMLSHWCIFYVFSQNTHEVLSYPKENEVCIAWIYSILYLYVPLMILPASYFFRWCNLFRIPFVYFIFINVERWYYGSWFCTNEMIDTHYILIYCIICIYIMELIELALRNRMKIIAFVKMSFHVARRWLKKKFGKRKEEREMDERKIDAIINQLREEEI